ncbi:MAG: sulfite exporter TauE/SafE family protein [Desulfarculus sp.]|nr:sulfite exporter TauE/SafE family protein [Desulfarculus sp.]
MDLVSWLLYAGVGSVAWVLAGLLGVGGGLVIVPALTFVFTALNLPAQNIMHLALGTSLATIIFTSVSSVRAHHARGAVHWDIVARITVGIILGTLAGTWVAAQLSTGFLKGFFAVFLFYVAAQLLLDIKPKASRQMPGTAGTTGVGGVIGVVSALVGIGGGSLSVPFMLWCNVPAREAIGTSAAIGFPIAISGAVGYLVNGLATPGLPAMSLGYIYLPALAGVALASVLTAPLGARLAHTLPVPTVKKIFALLLIAMGAKMVWGLF